MKNESNSLKAVLFALGANLSIAVIKYMVSLISGSSAMLAESIHSFADTTNRVFLLIGRKRLVRGADELHSLGYGKEEYFWGFLVGILLIIMSYMLASELRKLMVGESIPRETRNEIRAIIRRYPVIRHINNMRSMYIGNSNFILLIPVDVEDLSIGNTIENYAGKIKSEIAAKYPHAKYIYIDLMAGN